jgi:hypothetical protein
MSHFGRYVLPLMVFVFGWAALWIPAVWVKRGSFANGDSVISRATSPVAFWSWIIPSWFIGGVLMLFGLYLAHRIARWPQPQNPAWIGPRFLLWLTIFWFVFAFFGLVVQFVRA